METTPRLDRRITELEARLGKRLLIRSIRTSAEGFRARVCVRAFSVVVEYVEELPGYFWGYELLEELLDYVEGGGPSAIFYEGGLRYLAADV